MAWAASLVERPLRGGGQLGKAIGDGRRIAEPGHVVEQRRFHRVLAEDGGVRRRDEQPLAARRRITSIRVPAIRFMFTLSHRHFWLSAPLEHRDNLNLMHGGFRWQRPWQRLRA